MTTEVSTRPIMENNQALQTALELSMLNLTNSTVIDSPDSYGSAVFGPPGGELDSPCLPRTPRSMNVTQCVAVPSSEHVAEIVGRQGCKIKALRAKTNTYIKTPVRGEDPVFVITGRPEDVSSAKREVLAAAEHFTQIRAAKNSNSVSAATTPVGTGTLTAAVVAAANNNGGSINGSSTVARQSPVSPDLDKVSVLVKVPYRVVGLVVGPKGATIKRIQQITNTHIVTPSRDKEPCFEVSGKPEDVERAKKEIESYIAMRTGGCHDSDSESDYIMSPSVDSGVFSPPNSGGITIRKTSDTTSSNSKLMQQFSPRSSASPPALTPVYGVDTLDGFTCVNTTGGAPWAEPATRSPLSSAVFGGTKGSNFSRSNSFNSSDNGSCHFGTPPLSAPISHSTTKMFDFTSLHESLKEDPPSPTYSCSSNSSDGLGIASPKLPFKQTVPRLCCVCHEKDVVAALVPCGHNLFCASCAHVSAVMTGACPVCSCQVTSMLRLHH